MNGIATVQHDAPRNKAVDTPHGYIFVPWTRRELAKYRITVLGWDSGRAWQRFDDHTHNIRKEAD